MAKPYTICNTSLSDEAAFAVLHDSASSSSSSADCLLSPPLRGATFNSGDVFLIDELMDVHDDPAVNYAIDSSSNLASDGFSWSSSAAATSLMLPPSELSATGGDPTQHLDNAINHTMLRNSYDSQLTDGSSVKYRKHVWRLASNKMSQGRGNTSGEKEDKPTSLALLQYIEIGRTENIQEHKVLLGVIKQEPLPLPSSKSVSKKRKNHDSIPMRNMFLRQTPKKNSRYSNDLYSTSSITKKTKATALIDNDDEEEEFDDPEYDQDNEDVLDEIDEDPEPAKKNKHSKKKVVTSTTTSKKSAGRAKSSTGDHNLTKSTKKSTTTAAAKTTAKLQSLESQMPRCFRRSRSPSPFTADFLAKTSRELHTYSFLDKPEAPSAKVICADKTSLPGQSSQTPTTSTTSTTSTTTVNTTTIAAKVPCLDHDTSAVVVNGDAASEAEVEGRAERVDDEAASAEAEAAVGAGSTDKDSTEEPEDYAASYIREPPKWSKYIEKPSNLPSLPGRRDIEPIPFHVSQNSLKYRVAVEILRAPNTAYVFSTPPVLPQGGQMFLFTAAGRDSHMNDWRCDQYQWRNEGTSRFPTRSSDSVVKRHLYTLISAVEGPRFTRYAWYLLCRPDLVLVHYVGDGSHFVAKPHGNSRARKNPLLGIDTPGYVRTCPSVLHAMREYQKQTGAGLLKQAELKLGQQLAEGVVVAGETDRLEAVLQPRDIRQIQNVRTSVRKKIKTSNKENDIFENLIKASSSSPINESANMQEIQQIHLYNNQLQYSMVTDNKMLKPFAINALGMSSSEVKSESYANVTNVQSLSDNVTPVEEIEQALMAMQHSVPCGQLDATNPAPASSSSSSSANFDYVELTNEPPSDAQIVRGVECNFNGVLFASDSTSSQPGGATTTTPASVNGLQKQPPVQCAKVDARLCPTRTNSATSNTNNNANSNGTITPAGIHSNGNHVSTMPVKSMQSIVYDEASIHSKQQIQGGGANSDAILCVGLVCLDIISVCNNFPREDCDMRAVEQRWQRGGNASNNCTVLSKLGAEAHFAGVIAHNTMETKFILESFKNSRINCENLISYSCSATPVSIVVINLECGSRTIIHHNKNLPEFTELDFSKLDLNNYSWIHFELRHQIPEIRAMIEIIKKHNLNNPNNVIPISIELEKPRKNYESLLNLCDYTFISKDISRHRGHANMEEAIEELAPLCKPGSIIVIPWGEDGAVASNSKSVVSVPAFPPSDGVIDTLAAGDTFVAAFIYAEQKLRSVTRSHAELNKSLTFACKVAGLKCGVQGFDFDIDKCIVD